MKISKITISNILGIEAMEINPTGNIIEVTGGNGKGKTSVMNAIKDTLGLSEYSTLLRNGEKKGKTVLEFGDLQVSKTYNEKGSTLAVKGRVAGTDSYSTISAPAKLIKGIVSPNSVDPVRLLMASNKELVNAVLEALPMEVDPDSISAITGNSCDIEKGQHALVVISKFQAMITEKRKDVNRQAKEAKITQEQLSDTLPAIIPNTDTITDAIAENQVVIDRARSNARSAKRKVGQNWNTLRNDYLSSIDCLNTQISELTEDLREINSEFKRDAEEAEQSIEDAYDFELDKANDATSAITELQQELSTIGAIAKTQENIAGYAKTVNTRVAESEKYSKQLKQFQAYKEELCQDLPIEGLELTDGKLSMNGVPFETLNTAARIGLVIELAKLTSGKLGIVMLDNSEMLDSGTYAPLIEAATATDIQSVVARVTEGDLVVK